MGAFTWWDTVVLIVYVVGIAWVGARFGKDQESTQDYFLAGQRMPCFIVAMSMFASLTSAISYMGIPGTAFK